MKVGRITALFLVLILALVFVTGCGSNGQSSSGQQSDASTVAAASSSTDSETPKEVKTFKFFMGDSTMLTHPDLFGTTIGKKITEATGVKLDIEYLVGGTIQQKVGIMLASGDLPDFVDGHDAHQMCIDAGVLVPLESYIEKNGTNTKKVYGNIINQMKRPDGHIYELTPYREFTQLSTPKRAFWISSKVLKENSWPMITKWTDYMNIIRDYVKKHPQTNGADTIGFSFIAESWRAYTYTTPPVLMTGGPNNGASYYVGSDNKATYGFSSDAGKKYYNDLNTLWNEGLIDKEAFTQTYDQYMAKLTTGRVLGFFDESWDFATAQQTITNEGRDDDYYVPMPVVFDDAAQDAYNDFGEVTVRDGIAITTSCQDPEAAFKFLDDLQDEKLQKLMFWGIEGEDYVVDDKGRMTRTPEMIEQRRDAEYVKNKGLGDDWWYIYPHGVGQYSDGLNYWRTEEDPDDVFANYTDGQKAILKQYGKRTFAEFCHTCEPTKYGLMWSFNPPAGSEEATISTRLDDLAHKDIPKMIIAKSKDEFNSIFDSYVKETAKAGVDKYTVFFNNGIQERIKARSGN